MKIYVSDKEIDDNGLNYVEDDFVEEYFLSRGVSEGKGFEICDDVGLVKIQSLEQHDAEIRKPLEDEINELKDRIKKLKTANESFANLIEAVQEITGRKDVCIDDIVSLRKQERLKVIAELEERANTCHLVESIYEGVYCIDKDDLKQKLNEMKGE